MPPDNATDVRRRILDAALGLLAEHGFMEVTQPKIARAAGVRQSHLTYYFPPGASAGKLTPDVFVKIAGDALADKRRARVMLGLIVSSDEDRAIKQFLREFVVRVRATIANVATLLGRKPDQTKIVALHMLFVGAAVLNVARDDANSRRECAEIARIAIETFLTGDDLVPAMERQRRRK